MTARVRNRIAWRERLAAARERRKAIKRRDFLRRYRLVVTAVDHDARTVTVRQERIW